MNDIKKSYDLLQLSIELSKLEFKFKQRKPPKIDIEFVFDVSFCKGKFNFEKGLLFTIFFDTGLTKHLLAIGGTYPIYPNQTIVKENPGNTPYTLKDEKPQI